MAEKGKEYSDEQLKAIYELGRMYYEMGYFAPAERIFAGLIGVDNGRTPARLGLALVKLERGALQEAAQHFRAALQNTGIAMQTKLGLAAAFVAAGELNRARSILGEVSKEAANLGKNAEEKELRALWEALAIRTGSI